MFTVENRHIAALTDADLRTLVGMLCEAHLRAANLPKSAVTYGGDQRAADGGVDVRVDLPPDAVVASWVPRPQTVFQVKQEKNGLPPTAITAEMRPKDAPRPLLAELAASGGAYIIVSGMETLSDRALALRRRAMREAIADVPGTTEMPLDVYDGHRIARWANEHPGVAHWARHQIGEPLEGWRPFDDWTATPLSVESEYLVDDKGRLFDGSARDPDGLPIVGGLERIRASLAQPGAAVRLVGLSGMGKTRLVQTLFDGRVGANALDPAWVVYGDAGIVLDPPPQHMLARLARDGRRAVLIVDNCLPSLHATLVAELHATAGPVSLITVEYDIGDDNEHDSTAVFRLEPASDAVIEHLIARAHPRLAQPDRWRIVELSEGNARLALALAAAAPRGGSVAQLSKSDLFNRLFHQRNDKTGDQALLRAAEVCALVYSFDGETVKGEGSELPLLAELAEQTVTHLHRHVATLLRRQLVQKRDRWRAVLPQALAIHLARQALENIPTALLRAAIEGAPPRLLRSFTRRVGYLHDSEAAQDIVAAWLEPDGRLHDVARLDSHGWDMFENVAPVRPDLALNAIQAAADREGDVAFFAADQHRRSELVHLLHALAYEPVDFERAAWLMIRALATEAPDNNHYSGRQNVEALFALYLSGTHASQAERLRLIDQLLQHHEPRFNDIGVMALGAMLNAGHFSSADRHSFGARQRDDGWWPKTNDEQAAWFRAALARAASLAAPESRHAQSVRSMIADQFRELWSVPLLAGDVDAVIRSIAGHGFWPEAWKAVCMTMAFDHEHMTAESLAALRALEAALRPVNLVQKTRAYVLSEGMGIADLDDTELMEDLNDFSGAQERLIAKVRELGSALALADDALDTLLPELVTAQSSTLHILGRSLGEASPDINALWRRLVSSFAAAPAERRNATILANVLTAASVRNAAWTDTILDAAVADPVLGPCFPFMQSVVFIGKGGVKRLQRALETGLAPIQTYQSLGWCDAKDGLSDEDFAALVDTIAGQPGGAEMALEILFRRLYRKRNATPGSIGTTLIAAGRNLLGRYDVGGHSVNEDYRLSEMVKMCLSGPDAADAARGLCRAIAGAVRTSWKNAHDFQGTVSVLASLQPVAFLDAFVGAGESAAKSELFRYSYRRLRNPLLTVPRESLLAWADAEPDQRYPRLAAFLGLFAHDADDEAEGDDRSPSLAVTLLDRAPDRNAILAAFGTSLTPQSWSGNLSDILDNRRKRLGHLLNHADAAVRAWAEEADRGLAKWADAACRSELEHARRERSFE
ncbi:hypothetical protein [Roseomonas genomospecies 6]|uniref:Uncharacterized protein n=1 Tax=Roseomonas genomospecies 6 TaxID=214106 RepID=A0A9W7NEZ3_9PROT|nr:hypothetical protein [Roseomonas genomospecies 6]KAA0676142.1 hypothetical protein DS843_28510 [Roseomonas genomospecies 6]